MTSTATGTTVQGQLSEKILEFGRTLQRLVVAAKQESSLSPDFWAPLAAFIAVDEFERLASDYTSFVPDEASGATDNDAPVFAREVVRWPDYIEAMSQWALSPSLWEFTVQRIAELPGMVYLELEERTRDGQGGPVHVANSLSVYEFNRDGKIHRLRLAVADFSLRTWPACSKSSGVTAAP